MDGASPFYQSPIITDLCDSLGIDIMDNFPDVEDYITVPATDHTTGYGASELSSCMMNGMNAETRRQLSNYPSDNETSTESSIVTKQPTEITPNQTMNTINTGNTDEDDVVTLTVPTPESSPTSLNIPESEHEAEKNITHESQTETVREPQIYGSSFTKYGYTDGNVSGQCNGSTIGSYGSPSISTPSISTSSISAPFGSKHSNYSDNLPTLQSHQYGVHVNPHDGLTQQKKRAKIQPAEPVPRYPPNVDGYYTQNQPITPNMYYQMCWERYRQYALLAHANRMNMLPQSATQPTLNYQTGHFIPKHEPQTGNQNPLPPNLTKRPPPAHTAQSHSTMNINSMNIKPDFDAMDNDILDRQCRKIPSPGMPPKDILDRQRLNIPSPAVTPNDFLNHESIKLPSPAVSFSRRNIQTPSPSFSRRSCNTPDSGYSTPVNTPISRHESPEITNALPGSYILTSTPMHSGLKRRRTYTDDSGFLTDEQSSPAVGTPFQPCRAMSSNVNFTPQSFATLTSHHALDASHASYASQINASHTASTDDPTTMNISLNANHPMIANNSLYMNQSLNTKPVKIPTNSEMKLPSNLPTLTPAPQAAPCGGRRGRNNIPLNNFAVTVMTDWYNAHLDNPYPDKKEKELLAKQGGITVVQVKSWFANKRTRSNNTRPKVQQKKMKDTLMDICQQLTVEKASTKDDNRNIIKQLSTIVHQSQLKR